MIYIYHGPQGLDSSPDHRIGRGGRRRLVLFVRTRKEKDDARAGDFDGFHADDFFTDGAVAGQ